MTNLQKIIKYLENIQIDTHTDTHPNFWGNTAELTSSEVNIEFEKIYKQKILIVNQQKECFLYKISNNIYQLR